MVLKQQKIVVSITGGQTLTPTYTILNIETGDYSDKQDRQHRGNRGVCPSNLFLDSFFLLTQVSYLF